MAAPVVLLPFRTPPRAYVRLDEWIVTAGGGTVRAGELADTDRDPLAVLSFESRLSADLDRILTVCRLGPASRLEVAVEAHCPVTNIRSWVFRRPLNRRDVHVLRFDLAPHELTGQLELTTAVVVIASQRSDPLAPGDGSIIWSATARFNLDPPGDRMFPVQATTFSGDHEGAAWRLQIDLGAPDAPVDEAVVLLVNVNHPVIRRFLADEDSEAMKLVASALRTDVHRAAVRRALAEADLLADADSYPAGSVAAWLAGMVRSLFPFDEFAGLAERALHVDPEGIDAEIQARTRYLDHA